MEYLINPKPTTTVEPLRTSFDVLWICLISPDLLTSLYLSPSDAKYGASDNPMRCFDPRPPCGNWCGSSCCLFRSSYWCAEEGATEVDDHLWMTWRLSRRYRETRTTIKLKILVLFPGYTRSQVSSISSLMVRRVLEFCDP